VKLASVLLLSLPLGFLSGACQQGEGDFCQVTVDCADGLECNAGTQRCQKPGSTNLVDAAIVVIPDATPVPDATPADAAPSADAAEPDAGLPDATPRS